MKKFHQEFINNRRDFQNTHMDAYLTSDLDYQVFELGN